MRKTMIYLQEDQLLLLKKLSASSNRKVSFLIREAVAHYLKGKKQRPDYFSFVGIAKGPKKGKVSEQAEEVLREVLKSSS